MKSLFTLGFLILGIWSSAQKTQTTYYKGEWSRTGTSFNYTAMVKLMVTGNKVEGEIIWKLVSGDSLDADTYPYFRKLTGITAIEKISGDVDLKTGDLRLRGIDEVDPNEIIGVDEYALKWATGRKAIYGRTGAGGDWSGSFYATRVDSPAAASEFSALAKTVKKRSG